jgi:mono/diheme cytochrome c family protein
MAREHDAPVGMLAKLPLEFKSLAFEMHRGFDTIAKDAETVGSAKQTLGQLAAVLQQCVSCHSLYQVSAATEVR